MTLMEGLTLDAPLPDIAALAPDRQIATARWIRREARPRLLSQLSVSHAELDRMEADFRLRALERYTADLDAAIARHSPAVPCEDMPVRLHDLTIEADIATCRTELHFSPATKCLVHGPDAVRFALALIEYLLARDETIEVLETVRFRRVMPSNLRLEARVRWLGEGVPAAGDACITGTVRTGKGRRIDFRGVLISDAPVSEESAHNVCALAMLMPMRRVTIDGHAGVCLSLPPDAPWLARLDASRAFASFLLVELLGLLGGFRPAGSTATHLYVGLSELPVPERLGSLLRSGITLEYALLADRAVQRTPELRIVPFRFRFREFQPEPSIGHIAITGLSIPALIAYGAREGR